MVLCATCGHGELPQNAGLFWSRLSSPELAPDALCGQRFCVFGMGERNYADTFCEAAKRIEAERYTDRALCTSVQSDVQKKYEIEYHVKCKSYV